MAQSDPRSFKPRKRNPIPDARNIKGVRHPGKTQDDFKPVTERRRFQEWVARRERMSRV